MENQYRSENGRFWQLSVLYYALERPATASINFAENPDSPSNLNGCPSTTWPVPNSSLAMKRCKPVSCASSFKVIYHVATTL
ncbi:MAG: hypothetical protein M5U34_25545 [Chloroflexi bacterium]|nr:hypothetical protein [Chloroflexota bacterium]